MAAHFARFRPHLLVTSALAAIAAAMAATTAMAAADPPTLAVIPFADYAEDSLALPTVMPRVYAALAAAGIPYLSEAEVRPALRRFRIRSVGEISVDGARIIGDATGADAILVGSIDVFTVEDTPEVAISVRVVEVGEVVVAWAASESASRLDFAGPFGTGGTESIDALVDHTLNRLFDRLDRWIAEGGRAEPSRRPRLAIIPFDSAADYPNAGDIVSTILLPALVDDGFEVIEPGIVRELGRRRAHATRGSVDYPFLSALATEYGTQIAVTGTVESFQRSRSEGAAPAVVEISARLLDATPPSLIAGFHDTKSGHDSETLFRQGRCHAVGRLTGEVMKSLRTFIDRESEALGWTRPGAPAPTP